MLPLLFVTLTISDIAFFIRQTDCACACVGVRLHEDGCNTKERKAVMICINIKRNGVFERDLI